MSALLIALFWTEVVAILAWGFSRRDRLLTYPMLAAGVFGAFVGIPMTGLLNDPFFDEELLAPVALMGILCLGACWLGFRIPWKRPAGDGWRLSSSRLRMGGVALTCVGGVAWVGLRNLPLDLTQQAQWTGLPVAYYFFAQAMGYGLAICFLDYLRTRSRVSLVTALVAAIFYFEPIILKGRRGFAAQFLCVVACCLWFARGWRPSRAHAIGAIGLLLIVLFSIGEYRAAMVHSPERRWNDAFRIGVARNVQNAFEKGSPEIENAAFAMDATSRRGHWDYGLFHWNTLVFNYVPAQILGADFKESLMFRYGEDDAWAVHGHVPIAGSTSTGLYDSYKSFWYFGAVKFLLIAFVMQWLLRGALSGSVTSQLVYTILLSQSLHAITHHTQWFMSAAIHMAIFMGPVILFARGRSSRRTQFVYVRRRGSTGEGEYDLLMIDGDLVASCMGMGEWPYDDYDIVLLENDVFEDCFPDCRPAPDPLPDRYPKRLFPRSS